MGYSDARNQISLATLVLQYSKKELKSYTEFRVADQQSISSLDQAMFSDLCDVTKGTTNKERCDALREHLSARYTDVYVPRKVMDFATAFFMYLAKSILTRVIRHLDCS